MIGCHCPVCTSTDRHDQRTRASVVFSYASPGDNADAGEWTRVLVDTTPELRLQCCWNDVHRVDAVVFTHGHADHAMGLDDCRRFNVVKNGPLDVWADDRTHELLQRCFGYAFEKPDPALNVFRPHLVPRTITEPFEINGVTWTPIPLMHGQMPVLGFRVGKIAYCTDVSFIPESSYPLLEDLDVLVLDALQRKRHTTHFSLEQALDEARKIRAKQTYFTHIAHGLGHAETNAELPENIRLAHDGLRVRGHL
jgi:phosphoribosyl 1,2-cyclic phosphate phosphodiesterase